MMARWRIGAVEVKERVMRAYNDRIQAGMADTVWLAGCSNYYRAPNGKVVTQLPFSGGEYWLRTRIVGFWRYRYSRRHQRKGTE
jgi:cyclohexanone monooxygenase